MARYTGPSCRLCRREGKKLFLKGERCYSDKCAVTRRATVPGQHGKARTRKLSEYGNQLRAKQSAKRYYGVLESQFAKYFEMADRKDGVSGLNLLQTLETRFDNVVYRAGFAMSRKEARQLVRHGHYTINGAKVNIPSYLCKPGEEIAITSKSKESDKFKAIIEANSARPVSAWLDLNREQHSVRIIELPNRDQIDLDVEESMIVELYSK